jgi:glucose-1-phosphate cytidylyltransferase
MVEIGGKPILWHILKAYSHFGINDFIICLGYRGHVIIEFFANYFLHTSDVTFHMEENRMEILGSKAEPWRVTLVDTGDATMTGGRLRRVGSYLGDDESFCLTYGDGVADIDIAAGIALHREHGSLATMTAVQPAGRWGSLDMEGDQITDFREKLASDVAWINGGSFVLSRKVLEYIEGDSTVWEREPLERLAHEGQLRAYRHTGFWQPMDTLRDKTHLESLWQAGSAPWRRW